MRATPDLKTKDDILKYSKEECAKIIARVMKLPPELRQMICTELVKMVHPNGIVYVRQCFEPYRSKPFFLTANWCPTEFRNEYSQCFYKNICIAANNSLEIYGALNEDIFDAGVWPMEWIRKFQLRLDIEEISAGVAGISNTFPMPCMTNHLEDFLGGKKECLRILETLDASRKILIVVKLQMEAYHLYVEINEIVDVFLEWCSSFWEELRKMGFRVVVLTYPDNSC